MEEAAWWQWVRTFGHFFAPPGCLFFPFYAPLLVAMHVHGVGVDHLAAVALEGDHGVAPGNERVGVPCAVDAGSVSGVEDRAGVVDALSGLFFSDTPQELDGVVRTLFGVGRVAAHSLPFIERSIAFNLCFLRL